MRLLFRVLVVRIHALIEIVVVIRLVAICQLLVIRVIVQKQLRLLMTAVRAILTGRREKSHFAQLFQQLMAHIFGQNALKYEDDCALRRVHNGEQVGENERAIRVHNGKAEYPRQAKKRNEKAPKEKERFEQLFLFYVAVQLGLDRAAHGQNHDHQHDQIGQDDQSDWYNERQIEVFVVRDPTAFR